MSVMVFDGTSLATDSFANNGDLAFPYPKMWCPNGAAQPCLIYGVLGTLNAASALRQWCDTGLEPSQFPASLVAGTGAQLVIVSREKGLLRYNNSPIPHLHGLSKLAIGEGAPFAYGAMDHGATAEQAVATAIKYSIHCNGVPEVMYL